MKSELVYLDNAATTFPKPEAVFEAVGSCLRHDCGNPGRSAHILGVRSAAAVYNARKSISVFFGLDAPENVIFTANATWALNLILKGTLPDGAEVLVSDAEHNSVMRPLKALETRGIRTVVYPAAGLTDDSILYGIRARLTERTRMIVCNHVSNVTGQVLPVARIGQLAAASRILFTVDASQSAGIYDIDMARMHIDYLCAAGHKGLFGIQGTGIALLRQGAPVPLSLAEGGNGVNSLELVMPDFPPERLEPGTVNVPGIVSLDAGVQFLKAQSAPRIRQHIRTLSRDTAEFLSRYDAVRLYSKPGSSVLSFTVAGQSPAQTAMLLNEENICVRSGYHCAPLIHEALGALDGGTVRVSFSALNTANEVDRFTSVIGRIISSAGG